MKLVNFSAQSNSQAKTDWQLLAYPHTGWADSKVKDPGLLPGKIMFRGVCSPITKFSCYSPPLDREIN